ncbi:hypothetical protein CYY_008263 [Polysphondylium violaceum]|uniref:Autophagy-related protein 2 n=1 Tax=Polysphondylium violaceum TaxID=133409 RepID=A0A8J4PND0_9MYCE|nr:hypothetical protein CYY_008263 [Polysphondylium violaceum]
MSSNTTTATTTPTPVKRNYILDAILNKILRSLVNKQIKSLLVNPIQKSEFETRILESHSVKLKDVVFDKEKLQPKLQGLPFSMGSIKVKEIELKIPLEDIYNMPIEIIINGLEIDILPLHSNDDSSSSDSSNNSTSDKQPPQQQLDDDDYDSDVDERESSDEDIEVADLNQGSTPLLEKLQTILSKILHNIQVSIENLSLFLLKSSNSDEYVEINIFKSKFSYIIDNSNNSNSNNEPPKEQQQERQEEKQDQDKQETEKEKMDAQVPLTLPRQESFIGTLFNMFSRNSNSNSNSNNNTSPPSSPSSFKDKFSQFFSSSPYMALIPELPDIVLPQYIAQLSFQQVSIIYYDKLSSQNANQSIQHFYLFSTKKDDQNTIQIIDKDNEPLEIKCKFESSIYGNVNEKQLNGLLNHLSEIFFNTPPPPPPAPVQQNNNNSSDNLSPSPVLKQQQQQKQRNLSIDINIPRISYYLHLPFIPNQKLPKPNFLIHLNGENVEINFRNLNTPYPLMMTDIKFNHFDIDVLSNGLDPDHRKNNNNNSNSNSNSQNDYYTRYNCLKISGSPCISIINRFSKLDKEIIDQVCPLDPIRYAENAFFSSVSTSLLNECVDINLANQLSTCNIHCEFPNFQLNIKKSDYECLLQSFVLATQESTLTSIFTFSTKNTDIKLCFENQDHCDYKMNQVESFHLETQQFDLLMCMGYPDEENNPLSSLNFVSLDKFNFNAYYLNSNNVVEKELFLTNQLMELTSFQKSSESQLNFKIYENYDYDNNKKKSGNHSGGSGNNHQDYLTTTNSNDYLYTYCDSLEITKASVKIKFGSICFVPSMYFINQLLYWIKPTTTSVEEELKEKEQQQQKDKEQKQENNNNDGMRQNNNNIIELNNFIIHYGSKNSAKLKISSSSLVIFQLYDNDTEETLQFILYQTKIEMKELNYREDNYKLIGESYQSKDLQILFKTHYKQCSKIEIINHSYDIKANKKEFQILKLLFPQFLEKMSNLMVIKNTVDKIPETITQVIGDKLNIQIDDYESEYIPSPPPSPALYKDPQTSSSKNNNNTSSAKTASTANNTSNNNSNNRSKINKMKKKVRPNLESNNGSNGENNNKEFISFQIYIVDLKIFIQLLNNSNPDTNNSNNNSNSHNSTKPNTNTNANIQLEAHVSELIHTSFDRNLNNDIQVTEPFYDSTLIANIGSIMIRDNVSNYFQNLLVPLSYYDIIEIDDKEFEEDDDCSNSSTTNSSNSKREKNQHHQQQQKESIISLIFSTRQDSFQRVYYNFKIFVVPLFLELHQKTVDFLLLFFSSDEKYANYDFKDSDKESATTQTTNNNYYFDEFEIYPLQFKVDYKPSSIVTNTSNHSFTRGGFIWVFQMIPLKDAYFTLPHTHLHDIAMEQLSEEIMKVYSPHVFEKSILQYLTGVSPINICFKMGQSIVGLIKHPIKEAKDNESIIKGLGTGFGKGIKSITVELLTTSSMLSGFASKVIGTINTPSQVHNKSMWTSQPENFTEGATTAAYKIVGGFRKGVTGVVEPFSKSTTTGDFLKSMFWAVPGLIVNPVLGLTEGITSFSLGLRNSLDSTRIETDKLRFKYNSTSSNHQQNNPNNNK